MAARLLRSPPASSPGRRNIMRAIKSRDTGPELALRSAFREAGFSGYRVNMKGVPGRPDIAFTRYKLAIFVHGCFWHRCPKCNLALPKRHRDYWLKKFKSNVERDERNLRSLDAAGWASLVFWECQIRKKIDACVTRTIRVLSEAKDS